MLVKQTLVKVCVGEIDVMRFIVKGCDDIWRIGSQACDYAAIHL